MRDGANAIKYKLLIEKCSSLRGKRITLALLKA